MTPLKPLMNFQFWHFFPKGPMSVSRPFAIRFATTWVIEISSTIGVGKKFDVHGKV